MRVIEAETLSETVKKLFIKANRELPADVRDRIRVCRDRETWPAARETLDRIIENFEIAEKNRIPICQDTGMACVFLELGAGAVVNGDIGEAVNEGVRRACREGYLRASVVADPLRRGNTGDNSPAVLYVDPVPGEGLGVTVAPKGFGSENMSQIRMLSPSDGVEGLKAFVVSTLERAGPNPCPPVVVGVGIGGTFDRAALLAKKALLRPLGKAHADPFYAELEAELLEKINALGIGPQGFGGRTTALSLAIEVMPTHIAALPCAVNINCHVSRHAREEL
ncbi:MAG: fumarate hydratase [Treponema sp.]|jgi:fumarate hydratase subunit alpha|nr:fumarate hydratase [Treponema sp.]